MDTKYLLTILLACFFSHASFCQKQLAMVLDTDGFSNIRIGENINSEIVESILTGSFVFVEIGDSNWYICYIGDDIKGYIHKSRVIMFDKLDQSEKCQKIIEVLNKQIELDSLIYQDWKNDSLSNIRDDHTLKSFHPMTFEVTKYICETKDLEVFSLFQKAIWENRGSAAEEPKYNFGKLVYCLNEEMILNLKGNWSKETCVYWKGFFDQVINESINESLEDKNKIRKLVDTILN